MLAGGIDIALSVQQVESTLKNRCLLPLCWIVPALIVSLSAGITNVKGYGNSKFCWLSLESGLFWAFAGPALLIILINFIILVMILWTSIHSFKMKDWDPKEKAKAEIKNICVLLPLFGLTWVLGIFSVDEDLVVFQYLFAILNSLQGVFLFLFHCFLDKEVKKAIKHVRKKRRRSHFKTTKSKSPSSHVGFFLFLFQCFLDKEIKEAIEHVLEKRRHSHFETTKSKSPSSDVGKLVTLTETSDESNRSLRQRTDNQNIDETLQEEDDHGDDVNIAIVDVHVQFTDPEPEVGKLTAETDTKTKRRASEKVKKRTTSQLKKQSEHRPRRSNANDKYPQIRRQQHASSVYYYDNPVYPSMDGVPTEYRGYQSHEGPHKPVSLKHGVNYFRI